MIPLEKALKILFDIVKYKKEHQDYPRVTRYANLLKKLVTGEDMDELIQRFALREDKDLFKQRLEITQHITKPLCRAAYRPINKISRVTPIINEITYDEKIKNVKGQTLNKDKAKQNEAELKRAMSVIYGGESIDTYLEKMFGDLSAYDPNAFFLTSFANYDNRFEKPEPYNTIIDSHQAIYYEYFNNKLQYLVCRGDILIPIKSQDSDVKSTKKGHEFHLYADNDTIVLTQLDDAMYKHIKEDVVTLAVIKNPTNEPDEFYGKSQKIIKFKGERVFLIREYNQLSGVVPAVRVGCIPDPLTNGRTCISILDNAIPYLMKTIKTVSEMDLSMSLHAFPQKIVRTPRCPGADGDVCKNGLNRNNAKCVKCGGTGKAAVATSSQQTIELTLPEDTRNPEAMFDLEKIVHYVSLPIDILKFQNEYIEQLKADIMKAIYNSDIFTRSQISQSGDKTATESSIEYESVNDTLQPYGTQYSVIRSHIALVVAHYFDIAVGIVIRHRFPSDFKIKSLQLILADLAAAKDAPGYVKKEINRDIANNIYRDRPNELQKLQWQDRHLPFSGKSDTFIQYVLSNKKCTRETEVLYCNFEIIFVALEQEAELSNLYFYDYPYEVQKTLIDAEVKKIIDEIDASMPDEPLFDPNANPSDNGSEDEKKKNAAPEADQDKEKEPEKIAA